MPIEDVKNLIGCECEIIPDDDAFCSIPFIGTLYWAGHYLVVNTPTCAPWGVPGRHIRKSTKRMYVLDLLGNRAKEVDYR